MKPIWISSVLKGKELYYYSLFSEKSTVNKCTVYNPVRFELNCRNLYDVMILQPAEKTLIPKQWFCCPVEH